MRHNPYPASVLQTNKRSTTPTQPPVVGKWKRAFDMARSGQLSSENNLASQTAPPAKRMAIGPDENTVTIDDLSWTPLTGITPKSSKDASVWSNWNRADEDQSPCPDQLVTDQPTTRPKSRPANQTNRLLDQLTEARARAIRIFSQRSVFLRLPPSHRYKIRIGLVSYSLIHTRYDSFSMTFRDARPHAIYVYNIYTYLYSKEIFLAYRRQRAQWHKFLHIYMYIYLYIYSVGIFY